MLSSFLVIMKLLSVKTVGLLRQTAYVREAVSRHQSHFQRRGMHVFPVSRERSGGGDAFSDHSRSAPAYSIDGMKRYLTCAIGGVSWLSLHNHTILEDFYIPFRSIYPNALPIFNQLGSVFHTYNGRQTVFSSNYSTVGHHPTHFRH